MPDPSSQDLRVIKFGGSLLSLVDLKPRFEKWLDAQRIAINLVVCGGGDFVDALRKFDQIHCLKSSVAHWAAVDLMLNTSRLLAHLLNSPQITTQEELQAIANCQSVAPDCGPNQQHRVPGPTMHQPESATAQPSTQLASTQGVYVVQPAAYYTREIAAFSGQPLPETWECTSDSIAAYLAQRMQAAELVVLKSTTLLGGGEIVVDRSNLMELVSEGIVDKVFPTVARLLPHVRLVNLRADVTGEWH